MTIKAEEPEQEMKSPRHRVSDPDVDEQWGRLHSRRRASIKRAEERDAALKWELNTGAGGAQSADELEDEDEDEDGAGGRLNRMMSRELSVEEAEVRNRPRSRTVAPPFLSLKMRTISVSLRPTPC